MTMSEEKKEMNVTVNQEDAQATPTAEAIVTTPVSTPELDAVRAKLSEYGAGDDTIDKVVNDLGVESIDDLSALEVADLTAAGLKLVKARKLIAEFGAPAQTPNPTVATAKSRTISQAQFEALLPPVPNDDSWLNALKSGGILKVDESSYIAAIRAALADRAGLYDIPEALVEIMERYADETEDQVDPMFYSLRRSLTRRNYADFFAAIDGLDGTFVTERRRKEFLERVRETMWSAIAESFHALDSWYQAWRASSADPSRLLAALSEGLNGGTGMGMITPPPDTAQLHDAGDALVDSINRVFRGTGVQIAAAMAYDANTIRNTLEKPGLPAMVGVKNRELMLKKIHANVSSNYVRLEQNLVKYVLGFVKHDTVTSDVEVQYFVALWQLGTQINWNELNGSGGAGIESLTGKNVL